MSPTSVLSQQILRFKGEGAFEVLAKAKALEAKGRKIVHMEIGEPDFDTPDNIVQAGLKALKEGHTHYTPSQGILPLREAVATSVSQTRGVEIQPENVMITPGVKPLVFFCLMALLEPGDEVIVPSPAYPGYESMLSYFQAKPVFVPLLEERGFRFEVETLEGKITPKTKAIIINSPSNPTGGVLTREDMHQVADLAKKHDLFVISDEIYSKNLYDAQHYSLLSVPGMLDRTLMLDGFSKAYAMTGWRLGYGVLPESLIGAVTSAMLNTVSCVTTFVQYAGIEALLGDQSEVEAMVAQFRKRRDLLVDGLNSLEGITCHKPKGAFYVFPNVKKLGVESDKLASFLLEEAGVACLSGRCFGELGEGYLRFSYANSLENIEIALEKIEKALKKL